MRQDTASLFAEQARHVLLIEVQAAMEMAERVRASCDEHAARPLRRRQKTRSQISDHHVLRSFIQRAEEAPQGLSLSLSLSLSQKCAPPPLL